jgi:transglutaminase-like putative cysteine protease
MGGCPLDDPQLVRLTRQAVDGAESDRTKVRNIARFVKDYIRAVPGGVSMDVKDIMNTRQGDCGEHAMLFKAMCRAAGVPARVVLGYHPSGNPAEALMGHGWAEAAVDGAWLEADPIQNGIVRSPLRLRTAVMQSDDFADLFPLGGMQLKVRTVRRRAGSRPSP